MSYNEQNSTTNEVNLQGADLKGADLQRADLQGAILQRADLQGANLKGADIQRADLRGADLRGANLQQANLHGVDLHGADLTEADLRGANLNLATFPLSCGMFRVKVDDRLLGQLINHLLSLDHPAVNQLRGLKNLTRFSDEHQASIGWRPKPLAIKDKTNDDRTTE